MLFALAGCGGGSSSPQLVDGSRSAQLPVELNGLEDAVLTRTVVTTESKLDLHDDYEACGIPADGGQRTVIERTGVHGSSLTVQSGTKLLFSCDKIPDPLTAEDPDLPLGGIWCASANGRLDNGELNDPRLTLCPDTDNNYTAFVWVEARPDAKWVVVSDAGSREVYEVADSLPVRVTTTEGARFGSSRASFPIEEYAADGSKLRAYTLDAQVAG